MLNDDLKEIHAVEHQGDAREESFYPALGKLIEFYAKALGKAHIHVTQNPKKTEGGNPDFRIWDGRHAIIGCSVQQRMSAFLEENYLTE